MHKRKILSLILATALPLLLIGCEARETRVEGDTSTTETTTVGVDETATAAANDAAAEAGGAIGEAGGAAADAATDTRQP